MGKPEEQVFHKIHPEDLNEYFKEFMEDLTAKVFRTFNASFTLQQELSKFDVSKKHEYTQEALVKFYNNANREVAILCNHQKAESKQHAEGKKKMAETKMRLDKHITAMAIKEENKTVSLGTSKVNYMDPRITVAWCKKVDLAIERVFPRTVRTKFPWAMHFKSEYKFDRRRR